MKLFLSITYFITISLVLFLLHDQLGLNTTTAFLSVFILSLIYQIINFRERKTKNYLQLFKFNNFSGLLLFLTIINTN